MTATATATAPVRANWKGHEHRAELMFFGNDKIAWPNGVKVSVTQDGSMLVLSGQFVDGPRDERIGVAGKFWATPVPVATCSVCGLPDPGTDSHESDDNCCGDVECGACNGGNGGPAGHLDKPERVVKVPAARRDDGTCRCGCGLKVGRRSIFRQGHDAKMVSKLIERVRSGDLAPDMAIGAAALVSDALAAKTEKAVAKLAKGETQE